MSSSQLRLTPAGKSGWNLVEVYHNGAWGTLCDDIRGSWQNVGSVICRQIGSTNLTSITSAMSVPKYNYVSSNVQIWLDEILCVGTEHYIDYCNHSPWGSHDCSHGEDIVVKCGSCKYPMYQAQIFFY